jgi:transcriptional regulator with GAF, ATPase, and Fis domain
VGSRPSQAKPHKGSKTLQNKTRDHLQDTEGLFSLAQELLRLSEYDAILDTIVMRSLALLGGDRGFLVFQREGALNFKVIRNWNTEEIQSGKEAVSQTILTEILAGGVPLLIEDVLADSRFRTKESVQSLLVRSVLAAPLPIDKHTTGVIYLESRSNKRFFGPAELALFKKILTLSSHAIEAGIRYLTMGQRAMLLERDLDARYQFPGIITRDANFIRILKDVARVADSSLPVLIQGPSGTGKELIARTIHINSPRKTKPFITINCGAISPTLLESELFGHIKGAFTGATQNKTGVIAAADGGTLFLDEIGELPKDFQVKLLRVLQFGEIQPVGSTRSSVVDVRFVAATNRDLEEEVREGNFREDLLYRLNAVTIRLPSLAERRDDILPLFLYFLQEAATRANRSLPVVPKGLEGALLGYHWPGNIRELENEARRLLVLTPQDEPLMVERLSNKITAATGAERPLCTLAEIERETVAYHLKVSNHNLTHAAETLGISREGLRKMLKRYKLE